MAVYKENATGTWQVIYRFINWKMVKNVGHGGCCALYFVENRNGKWYNQAD